MKNTHWNKPSIKTIQLLAILICLINPAKAQTDSLVAFSKQNDIIFRGEIKHTDDLKILKSEFKKVKNAITLAVKNKAWKLYKASGEAIVDSIDYFIADKGKGILISKNYSLGLINNEGNLTAEPLYAEIKVQDGHILAKARNLIAIKSKAFLTNKELRFSSFRFLSKQYGIYGIEKKLGIIDLDSYSFITKPIYDEISLFNDTSFTVKSANKVGLINSKNELLIPIEYASITKDTLNFIKLKRIRENNGIVTTAVGICNYKGRVLIPLIYKEIGEYTNGLFPALNEKYWGYLGSEGEQVIPFFYDTYGKFVSGLAAVTKNGLVGIIDKKANWIAFPEYETVQYVNDSIWIWSRGGLSGFYSTTEKRGIPYMYEGLELINSNFVRFSQSGKFGLLSAKRKTILHAEWDKIEVFDDEKVIIAAKNNYYSIFYLNGNLKVFMNYPFTRFDPYKDGMALVVQKNKYGFIDRDGLLLVSTQYDEARPFSNGLAAVKIGNIWGFVDKKENFIAHPYYDMVKDFDSNAAIVSKNSKYGLINLKGKETSKPQFDEITHLPSGNYLLRKEGRYGIANEEGTEKINPIYKDILELTPGIFRARLYGKYSLIDINHKLLTTFEYDNIEYGLANNEYIFTTRFEWKALK